ncbi:MAG: hypothetical protein J7527_14000, partial [Chitinophagaceae bacterium]|nr:hypothetical protein [Chitinophagaceae bacterium]
VLSVPANGFLYADGGAVKGTLQLVVKEALDAASIIKAGLSTVSGDRPLETGGMFFIDARQGDQILKINQANAISAAIPSDTIKPGMMLFAGERTVKGDIDWRNPTQIRNSLVTVDMHKLNFYPPGYLDSLKEWGSNISDKKFTDSLYFSFAELFQTPETDSRNLTVGGQVQADTLRTDSSYERKPYYQGDAIYFDHCAINPASVKAFWHDKFQHTFIATRQFEERMKYIHLSGDQEILDLYINNLDKDLSYVDSLVVNSVKREALYPLVPKFQEFAGRRDGNVTGGGKSAAKLAEYFRNKTALFTEQISKAQREFWTQQASLDETFFQRQSEYIQDSIKRMNKNFQQEYELNLKEARRQLDMKFYTVSITTTGWKNVDRYVEESVRTQTTLDYTDPQTGKKAVIRYEPVSFGIEDAASFDRLSVYLIPDQLSSYIKLNASNAGYSGKLNELMKYNLAVVGYKNDNPFFYSMKNVSSQHYAGIKLSLISERNLIQQLNMLASGAQAKDIGKEQDFLRFEIKDKRRQDDKRDRILVSKRIFRLIFAACLPEIDSATK